MYINGNEEMGSAIQQYCLRWNNHRSNLLLVFEHLFQTEAFTDVTLACEGASVKCHKMVLAACSSYFQHLFMENDCRHPIVILKDIRFSEIKAILEYMYKGEVNVAQDQLAGLLKAAETLKVKGLVEDNHNVSGTPTPPQRSPYPPTIIQSAPEYHSSSYPKSNSVPAKFIPNESMYDSPFNANALQDRTSMSFPLWSGNKLSPSPSPKHSLNNNNNNNNNNTSTTNNNNSYDNSQNEPVPLKKKKYIATSKDTPILRTVLGHTSLQVNTESPQQPPPVQQQKSNSFSSDRNTNGGVEHSEKVAVESPDQYMEDFGRNPDSDKVHEDNHSYNVETEDSKIGIATYVPTQKPEWKRYKQYTRTDIMAAIEAVRAGMSALQAARKFGVPSRTLYDKVKKLGITTNRPYRKGSFPTSPYLGMVAKNEDGSNFLLEDQPFEVSSTGNENGNLSGNGNDGDSDKMDSGSGSGSSLKQEQSDSPPSAEYKEDSSHNKQQEDTSGNGLENCNSSPRETDPSEADDLRSVSQ